MSEPSMKAVLASLHVLLDSEADQLRRADFSSLSEQGIEKERLMNQLDHSGPIEPGQLLQLQDHARYNATLMAAALRGVRAARRRFDLLRHVQSNLHTYDRNGQRRNIVLDGVSVERRA